MAKRACRSRLCRAAAAPAQVLATVCLLAHVVSYGEAVQNVTRSRNGVRLVGGTNARGRLEIASRAWWLMEDDGNPVWRPVCHEGGLVDDDLAQIMCILMGFKHGRRYYRNAINNRKPNASLPYNYDPLGYLRCELRPGWSPSGRDRPQLRLRPKPPALLSSSGLHAANAPAPAPTPPPYGSSSSFLAPSYAAYPIAPGAASEAPQPQPQSRHRHLMAGTLGDPQCGSGSGSDSNSGRDRLDGISTDLAWSEQVDEPSIQRAGQGGRGSGTARSLLAPLTGMVDIPEDAPYTCSFRLGDCKYQGPLVGIHCFNKRMPPAPPPPPSPPNPPPAPPPISTYIKVYGGGVNGLRNEPNLCSSNRNGCDMYGRVELLVDAPGGGGQVWAPICSYRRLISYGVAQVACWQAFDWPRFTHRPAFTVRGEMPNKFLPIPQNSSEVGPGDFDPASYQAWVTVQGGNFNKATKLQDLKLQVSTQPCESRTLFAVFCQKAER